MENLLQGIPHVVVRVDDILVSSKDDPDHLANLEAVLSGFFTAGFKAMFGKMSVDPARSHVLGVHNQWQWHSTCGGKS